VADLEWQGDGPVFAVEAEGLSWQLDLDSPHPSLSWSDQRSSPRLLSLDHVVAVGRRDESAFAGVSLVSFERHRGRIQAIFAPAQWRGLNIRSAWGPTPDRDGFDLEVRVWSTSKGVFRRLEVAVTSSWWDMAGEAAKTRGHSVEPRDVHTAALSYDGREPADLLRLLTTRPGPASSLHQLELICCAIPGTSSRGPRCYLEMVQPNDCARRISGDRVKEIAPAHHRHSTRYGLFGYDLEKGVVLRGRVRGAWLACAADEAESHRRYEAFLAEAPALGP
jgi:hypothetical protein